MVNERFVRQRRQVERLAERVRDIKYLWIPRRVAPVKCCERPCCARIATTVYYIRLRHSLIGNYSKYNGICY